LWFFGFVVLLICGFGGWGRLYAFETGGMKKWRLVGWKYGSMDWRNENWRLVGWKYDWRNAI
jgi:hypothetical protein